MMEVAFRTGSYPIEFIDLDEVSNAVPRDAVLITDENVRRLYPEILANHRTLTVPAGEASKSLETYAKLQSQLAQMRAKRKTTIVALGGGVVGDLAGFVAATYLRGVPLIQVPTTLLSMVDSSVGGKVGLDLPEGKNLVGAFYAPMRVLVSVGFVKTLPERQLQNGMAEVWKYAFIMDASLISTIVQPRFDFESVTKRCIELKKRIVEEDEFETSGRRAILNFGHTIGHGIETLTGYNRILHGEAISIGMVFESRVGEKLGVSPVGTADSVAEYLKAAGLPVEWPEGIASSDLIDAMLVDKKTIDDQSLSFSLLTAIGHCKLVHGISPALVREVISEHEKH